MRDLPLHGLQKVENGGFTQCEKQKFHEENGKTSFESKVSSMGELLLKNLDGSSTHPSDIITKSIRIVSTYPNYGDKSRKSVHQTVMPLEYLSYPALVGLPSKVIKRSKWKNHKVQSVFHLPMEEFPVPGLLEINVFG